MYAVGRRAVAPVVRGAHNFLDWRGLAWPIEVRGLANRSEGLANRSEGLANRSEGLGAGLAQDLSIKVRGWGPGRPRPCQ